MLVRISIILAFIAASAIWWLTQGDYKTPEQTSPVDELIPDFTATGLHQQMFDTNGVLVQQIFASSMEHYDALALTHFIEPEFVLYQQGKPLWRIRATTGSLQDNVLLLDDKVQMEELSQQQLIRAITSEYLEIDLAENTVSTSQAITLTGDKLFIRGEGLFADLNEGTVTLTNHVETRIKRL